MVLQCDTMTEIGVRELRHRLREVVRRAESGETFSVTLYGRTVATLGPAMSGTSLARLIEEGKVTPPLQPDTSRLPDPLPVTTGMTATQALLAERRDDRR